MVAGIVLVGTILVLGVIAMLMAGAQADESSPLYWFASLFSGFIQSVEQRHQEATQYKESLGKDQDTIESAPEIKEPSSFESQLAKGIPQSEIQDGSSNGDSFIQMQETESITEQEAESITEQEALLDPVQNYGGSGVHYKSSPIQEPITIAGQFDEETQSWELTVLGSGFSSSVSLMVIISTADSESSTIASFEVQTDVNGDFYYSPGTLYDNLETDLYQVKILGNGVQIFNEWINFEAFPEDVITWSLNPASLVAGESATLQVFGQVNLPGPYFQNTIMILEGYTQTESISLIVMPDGELFGSEEITFYESGTYTVKVFYDSLVREGTFEVSP